MRSLLYCPADTPKMMLQAGIYGADAVIFDLEDSVASDNKDQARILLAEFLKNIDMEGVKTIVRINSLSSGEWERDLQAVVPLSKAIIRLPKVEKASDVETFSQAVSAIEKTAGITEGSTKFQLLLETPSGIENAFKIAAASGRSTALTFGAEDYCASTGIPRTGEPFAFDYVRGRIVCAAAAFGLACYDTAWGILNDPAGLERESRRSRILGFDGKSVIHPDQIDVVNSVFSYTEEEVSRARRVLENCSRGVSVIDGRMIDPPVITQAKRILDSLPTGQPGKQ